MLDPLNVVLEVVLLPIVIIGIIVLHDISIHNRRGHAEEQRSGLLTKKEESVLDGLFLRPW
jgi:hypothetical protein